MIVCLIADIIISVMIKPFFRIHKPDKNSMYKPDENSMYRFVMYYAVGSLEVLSSIFMIILTGLEYKFLRSEPVK